MAEPAPAYLPMRSYTPMPVSVVPRKISTEVVNMGAVISPRFSRSAHSVSAWPTAQISPPTQKARR